MRVVVGLSLVVLAIVIATAGSSRGDGESADSPPEAVDEPVTGTPIEPLPGTPTYDALAPYTIGGPEAAWSYEQLRPEEKVVADRGLDEDQTAVQDAYAGASAALAAKAHAEAAALQLGFDGPLEETGVVP